jgi:hypothetical protein
LFFADGHTESQMLPYISYRDKTVVFAADLLPSASHIPMPFVMGYDVRPLETMKEKAIVLNAAAGENHILFFEHDIQRESALVEATEKGVRLKHSGTFEDMLTA